MSRFEQSSEFFQQVNFRPELFNHQDYMSREVVDVFKQVLILWKKALIESNQDELEDLKSNTSTADLSDQASIEESFALHLKAQDRKRKLMHKIDEALLLIERGEYGFCHDCGIEIGYDRLMARPTANMCIDCKTASEIKERHSSGGSVSDIEN